MSELSIIGYGVCRLCGEIAPEAVLIRSGRICGLCTSKGLHPSTIKRLIVEGKSYPVPKKAKTGSRGKIETKRLRRNAEGAAERRLKKQFPAHYRVILAEERSARGLEPYPIYPGPVLGDLDEEAQKEGMLLDFTGVYDARQRR